MIRAAIISGVWVGLLVAMSPAADATAAVSESDGHGLPMFAGFYNPGATLDPTQVRVIPAGE